MCRCCGVVCSVERVGVSVAQAGSVCVVTANWHPTGLQVERDDVCGLPTLTGIRSRLLSVAVAVVLDGVVRLWLFGCASFLVLFGFVTFFCFCFRLFCCVVFVLVVLFCCVRSFFRSRVRPVLLFCSSSCFLFFRIVFFSVCLAFLNVCGLCRSCSVCSGCCFFLVFVSVGASVCCSVSLFRCCLQSCSVLLRLTPRGAKLIFFWRGGPVTWQREAGTFELLQPRSPSPSTVPNKGGGTLRGEGRGLSNRFIFICFFVFLICLLCVFALIRGGGGGP